MVAKWLSEFPNAYLTITSCSYDHKLTMSESPYLLTRNFYGGPKNLFQQTPRESLVNGVREILDQTSLKVLCHKNKKKTELFMWSSSVVSVPQTNDGIVKPHSAGLSIRTYGLETVTNTSILSLLLSRDKEKVVDGSGVQCIPPPLPVLITVA